MLWYMLMLVSMSVNFIYSKAFNYFILWLYFLILLFFFGSVV